MDSKHICNLWLFPTLPQFIRSYLQVSHQIKITFYSSPIHLFIHICKLAIKLKLHFILPQFIHSYLQVSYQSKVYFTIPQFIHSCL